MTADSKPREYRDIPEHEHTHSLYVRCHTCQTWGTSTPTPFLIAAQCGNCGSSQTVKYYPACCIMAERNQFTKENAAMKEKYDILKKEYDDYINGQPGSWYIVELKKERDSLERECAALRDALYFAMADNKTQASQLMNSAEDIRREREWK